MKDRIFRVIGVLAAALVLMLLFLSQSYLTYARAHQDFPWQSQLANGFTGWLLWAAFFPLILAFARRFRFETGSTGRSVLFHIVAGIATAIAHALAQTAIVSLLLGAEEETRLWQDLLGGHLGPTLLWRFIMYQVILTVCVAVDIQHRWRDMEIQSSRIESRLLQARVEMLRMQIDPEFIFRSLRRLSRLMRLDLDEADTMVARLGDYLRTMLDRSTRTEVLLAQEIESVRAYMNIEMATRETCGEIAIDISDKAAACTVPGMILQAPVEDALERREQNARTGLRITASTTDSALQLTLFEEGGTGGSDSPRLRRLLEQIHALYRPAIRAHSFQEPAGHVTRIEVPLSLSRHTGDDAPKWEPAGNEPEMDSRYTSNPVKKWLVIVGIFTFLAAYFSVQSRLLAAEQGRAFNWATQLLTCTAWYVWALITPFVLKVSATFPLGRSHLVKHTVIHLVALFASYVAACIGIATVQWASNLGSTPLYDLFVRSFTRSPFSLDFICYVTIVTVETAGRYAQRMKYCRVRSARLEAQLARARLQALRMQLHPHFLFNALNSLSELMQEDPSAAEEMISNLDQFLRLTLDETQSQEIPFEKELEFLRCYLAIESVRFQERLRVTMDIEPQAMRVPVPNLVLQPIVENAIKHGVAPRATPGQIDIHARRHNGVLELRVRDNGPGLRKSRRRSTAPRMGLGLANTKERLHQLYGHNHRFELTDATEGGLVVTVTIPVATPGG